MEFILSIDLANDAMRSDDEPDGRAIASILRDVAGQLDDYIPHGTQSLWDVNGNKVGSYHVTED